MRFRDFYLKEENVPGADNPQVLHRKGIPVVEPSMGVDDMKNELETLTRMMSFATGPKKEELAYKIKLIKKGLMGESLLQSAGQARIGIRKPFDPSGDSAGSFTQLAQTNPVTHVYDPEEENKELEVEKKRLTTLFRLAQSKGDQETIYALKNKLEGMERLYK